LAVARIAISWFSFGLVINDAAAMGGPTRFGAGPVRRDLAHDPEKWAPVSRLREALSRFVVSLDASAGEGRSEKIMRQQEVKAR
jgi:hypothetical protein